MRPVLWICLAFAALKLAIQVAGNIVAQHAAIASAGAVAWMAWAAHKAWHNVLVVVLFVGIEVAALIAFLPFSIPVLPPQHYITYAKEAAL